MKHRLLTACILTWMFIFQLQSQSQIGERAQWFVNDRFGMFIHWGLYSGAEGVWKGERLRHANDYAEWIQYRNRISKKEYLTLLNRFDWENIDPEKWVLLAKRAGMKYVTLTSKHHDGFALWNSTSNPYNIVTHGGPDIVAELAAACKKHGLKMGLYYSHWVDWEHPYGWDHSKEVYPITPEQYDIYWKEKVIPQMRELLTNYGDLGLIWFDMWVHHSQTIVQKQQLVQLKHLIRRLQPNCLINSRLGLSIEEDSDVDFRTLGDNQLGNKKLEYPWQTPATIAHSWGFHALEDEWKSTTSLLKNLIGNVSLNGNIMLNVGPRANGDVPYEITSRLRQMGDWFEVNGESIYGASAFELRTDMHDWGKITARTEEDGRTKLYLHIFNWPLENRLTVTGIFGKPERAYLLANRTPISFETKDVLTQLQLPIKAPDKYVSVIVLEYPERPEVDSGLVARSANSEGYALTARNAIEVPETLKMEKSNRYETVPEHLVVDKTIHYQWKIAIDRPMTLRPDISYSYQGERSEGEIQIAIKKNTRKISIQPTGKTVGEPNQNWIIDSYDSHSFGEIHLPSAGTYTITLTLSPVKDKILYWQWLWLNEVK